MRAPIFRLLSGVSLIPLAALTACDSPLSPSDLAGTYVLTATGAASLPVVIHDDESITVAVLSDTIRLERNGTGEHARRHLVTHHDNDGQVSEGGWTSGFQYAVRGSRIEISYNCPPNALCAPPPHEIGRWRHDGFTFESMPAGYRFVRLP